MRSDSEFAMRGPAKASEPMVASLFSLSVLLVATAILVMVGWAAGHAARSVLDVDLVAFVGEDPQ